MTLNSNRFLFIRKGNLILKNNSHAKGGGDVYVKELVLNYRLQLKGNLS